MWTYYKVLLVLWCLQIDVMPLVLLYLQIDDFIKELCEYQYHSNGLLDAPKVLSDIVESLIGAIYLDSNFNQEVVWRVSATLRIISSLSVPHSCLGI
jgi:hypothetical protein